MKAEQVQLRKQSEELSVFITENEQKSNDVETFMEIVHKYEVITYLTPEVMNELIDRIEVHAPDKSSGHRRQAIDIYFRFNVANASAEICNMDYCKTPILRCFKKLLLPYRPKGSGVFSP